jgi:isopentenyl phosphate kinase
MARALLVLIVALPSLAVALRPLLRRLRSPPPRDVTVVKLGGSAITDKARFETLDEAGLRAAAEAVRRCVADGRRVVVVHGAGSFGHFQAREHGVSRGGDGDSWRLGLAVTRRSVTKLNGLVVDALARAGVPAVAVAAFPRVATRRRELRATRATAAFVADALRLADDGFTPVLHGDAVLDDAQRCAIVSGDALLRRCAADLAARGRLAAVCFLTDVDGVFTRPPAEPGAALVADVVVDGAGAARLDLETSAAAHDVTGGIRAKIDAAAAVAAATRAPVDIVRATSAADVDAALRGARPPRGTRIRPET